MDASAPAFDVWTVCQLRGLINHDSRLWAGVRRYL